MGPLQVTVNTSPATVCLWASCDRTACRSLSKTSPGCVNYNFHVSNFLLDPAESHAKTLKCLFSSKAAVAWLSSTSLLMSPEFCVCQRGHGQPHAFWKRGQMSQGSACAWFRGPEGRLPGWE